MRKIFMLLMVLMMGVGLSGETWASLLLRGIDSMGYRLIYDDDLDITWYDATFFYWWRWASNSWQNQMDRVGALIVDFGGTIYDDWRLPSTVDEPYVWGWDGTTTAGYNVKSSEMGHLFYTELGNLGYYDTSVNYVGDGNWGLLNTGNFHDLINSVYWSGTEYSTNPISAWVFDFHNGTQFVDPNEMDCYALAVRDGDVSVIPEPSTLFLLGSGFVGLLGVGFGRHRAQG